MVQQDLSPLLAVSVLVLDLLFGVDRIVRRDLSLQVSGQLLDSYLQVGLVVFKNDRMVVFLEVEGERVRVHERLATQTKHLDSFLEELDLLKLVTKR